MNMQSMDQIQDEERYFAGRPASLALYRFVRDEVLRAFPSAVADVQKTQITFRDPFVFACVWLPPRPVKGHGDGHVVLSFSLDQPVDSPRVERPVQVRANCWTHHLWLSGPQDMDAQALQWVADSHALPRRRLKTNRD
jgi:hypothetical protein